MSGKRDDYRKLKQLEEQRKTGDAPAEVDAESGLVINPHIPAFITQAPFYVSTGQPSLGHQRVVEAKGDAVDKWYPRGQTGQRVTKFRKGACGNCGALSHKAQDCVERPRKVGAKWSGTGFAADEAVASLELGFAAKRDRWNGYDATAHLDRIREFELVEETRRQLRDAEVAAKIARGELDAIDDSDDDEDAPRAAAANADDKYAEASDMPGQKVDTKARLTVRNLRIREDTAKYLLNLDPESAYYDPKTRSMRENPLDGRADKEVPFAGDNFVRHTGDVTKMAQLQLFAWEAEQRGKNVSLQANPTMGELLYKQYLDKKTEVTSALKKNILDRYGGEEHLKAPPKELLLAQTEQYVEYNPQGRVVRGQERSKLKSRYDEDVLINNHTAVWGSYWKKGQWGYKCCHNTTKNSYCVGDTGKEVEKMEEDMIENGRRKEAERGGGKTLADLHLLKLAKGAMDGGSSHEDSDGDDTTTTDSKRKRNKPVIDRRKLQDAVEKERKRRKMDKPGDNRLPDDSEKASSTLESTAVSDQDMEKYRLAKKREEDPMANYRDDND